jgi:hypothetical protein
MHCPRCRHDDSRELTHCCRRNRQVVPFVEARYREDHDR